MKSADEIKRLFNSAAVQTNAAPDDAVFETLKTAYTKTVQHKSAQREPSMWRFVMKNPLTKIAVAAAVVVAGVIGVWLWKQTGSGLALADVLARMEQVQTYRLKISSNFQFEGAESKPVAEAEMLVSRDLGQKTVMQVNHPITGQSMLEEIYLPADQRTVITLMPNEKQYSKVEVDAATIEQWQSENDPRYLVERVTKCRHTRLGRSVIDGTEVEGFQTTDPNSWGGMPVAGAEIKIWADVETRLPVRIEIGKDAPGQGHLQVVAHDFEWSVPAEAGEFTPVIPADYTPGRPMMQLGPKK